MKSVYGVLVRWLPKRAGVRVACLCAALFAGVALALLARGNAATSAVNVQPENGVVSSKATVILDSSAAGGKAIRFAAQSSGGTSTGGSGGPQTDRTNLSYTANGVTSSYHLYAAGLDWSKKVGILIYGDGSAEYGLKNPSSTYLLAGTNGLINVAKRNNMILLTPLAPGAGCPDGDGTCWYQTSSGFTPLQKPSGQRRW